MTKILAFCGSTRKDSLNKKLLAIAVKGAKDAGASVNMIDMQDYSLPIFNQDDEQENGMPENARQFKQLLVEADGMLIASPEYNGSYSALLKNSIDWASRSEAENEAPLIAYRDKFAAIMSASPGSLGGLRGLTVLRMLLSGLGMMVLPKQVAIPNAMKAFDFNDQLINDKQRSSVLQLGASVAHMARKHNG